MDKETKINAPLLANTNQTNSQSHGHAPGYEGCYERYSALAAENNRTSCHACCRKNGCAVSRNNERDLYQEVSIVAMDALKGRLTAHGRSKLAVGVNLFYHSKYWDRFYLIVACVNLALAFIELPSSFNPPIPAAARNYSGHDFDNYYHMTLTQQQIQDLEAVTSALEISCTIVYITDVVMLYIMIHPYIFVRSARTMSKTVIVTLIALNNVVCLCYPAAPLLFRALRPFLFLTHLRNVRLIFFSILRSSVKVLNVLILLVLLILFFGIVMFVAFSGIDRENCAFGEMNSKINISMAYCSTFAGNCQDYFSTYFRSLLQLFVLLTTANYPDVMMPAYDCSWFASIPFVLYLILGLYTILSLVLAVVYTHFQEVHSKKMKSYQAKCDLAAEHAFALLAAFPYNKKEKYQKFADMRDEIHSDRLSGYKSLECERLASHRATMSAAEVTRVLGLEESEADTDNDNGAEGKDPEQPLEVDVAQDTRLCSLDSFMRFMIEFRPDMPIEIALSIFATADVENTGHLTVDVFCALLPFIQVKFRRRRKRQKNVDDAGKLWLRKNLARGLWPCMCCVRCCLEPPKSNEGRATKEEEEAYVAPREPKTSSYSLDMQRMEIAVAEELETISCKEKYLRARALARAVVRGKLWQYSVDVLVAINCAFILGGFAFEQELATYPDSADIMNTTQFFFIIVFTLELVIKIPVLGKRFFCPRSRADGVYNIIDVVAVVGSIVAAVSDREGMDTEAARFTQKLVFLRTIRLLRLLRLLKQFSSILTATLSIIPAMSRYLTVMASVYYFFAVIGMELFANLLYESPLNPRYKELLACSYGHNQYWNNNFDNMHNALVTLFEQMVVNNWPIVMEGCIAVTNPGAVLFFLGFYLCAVLFVINVLVAFFLDSYQHAIEAQGMANQSWQCRLNQGAERANVDISQWIIVKPERSYKKVFLYHPDEGKELDSAVINARTPAAKPAPVQHRRMSMGDYGDVAMADMAASDM